MQNFHTVKQNSCSTYSQNLKYVPGGQKNGTQENCSRSLKNEDIFLKSAVRIA